MKVIRLILILASLTAIACEKGADTGELSKISAQPTGATVPVGIAGSQAAFIPPARHYQKAHKIFTTSLPPKLRKESKLTLGANKMEGIFNLPLDRSSFSVKSTKSGGVSLSAEVPLDFHHPGSPKLAINIEINSPRTNQTNWSWCFQAGCKVETGLTGSVSVNFNAVSEGGGVKLFPSVEAYTEHLGTLTLIGGKPLAEGAISADVKLLALKQLALENDELQELVNAFNQLDLSQLNLAKLDFNLPNPPPLPGNLLGDLDANVGIGEFNVNTTVAEKYFGVGVLKNSSLWMKNFPTYNISTELANFTTGEWTHCNTDLN